MVKSKKKAGIPARKYNKTKSQILDLKAPSYKWLLCRKCKFIEVEVSVEAFDCVCAYCLISVCDYMPTISKPKTPPKSSISSFAKMELKAQQQAGLADNFKKKQASIKNGNSIVKKKKKQKKKFKKNGT